MHIAGLEPEKYLKKARIIPGIPVLQDRLAGISVS
jgi:hypothetical protein